MKKPREIKSRRDRTLDVKRSARGRAAPSGAGAGKKAASERPPRIRLDPAAREKMILDAAVLFFAEHGFEAQLSDLVARLGISQGLIFKYFGNKQNLVERVYERVYVARWLPDWERILRDRSQPIEKRLVDFFRSYLAAVDDYVWIRTSLYSGLAGNDLTRRYIMTRVERLLGVLAEELMAAARNVSPEIQSQVHEIAWHLHSTFIYYLIRKYVYGVPVADDRDGFVAAVVRQFMAGFCTTDEATRRANLARK